MVGRHEQGRVTVLGRLAGLFRRLVQDTDTAVGMVYVLSPQDQLMHLAVLSGLPRRLAAPWVRMEVGDAVPVAEAIRERRLIWLSSPKEMARRYPRIGLIAPYEVLVVAAPLEWDDTVHGGVCLLWPAWHPPQLSDRETQALEVFRRRAGHLLGQAARHGRALLPQAEPVVLSAQRPRQPRRAEALAAYDFAERLPVGCCSLDLEGRVTFLNTAAAELLGVGAADLLGSRPWERLLWLGDPALEDQYRAAVMSKQSTAFTVLKPPDQWLSFQLCPAADGISVNITPLPREQAAAEAEPCRTAPAGPLGASALYHLMYLAATLTQAVSVQDVVDQVGDQLVPAFEAQGLVLMAAGDGRLCILGSRGYDTAFLERFEGDPLASATPPAQAIRTQTPAFFTSFTDFQHAYPEAPRYKDRDAWAFLPLITSGRAVGLLVLSYDRPRPFPVAERTVLASLAGLIAQALDRARLYDAQHHLARTLQTGLLPQELPHIPGLKVAARYLPAGHGMDIGGDFYELIHCTPTTAAAVIGDVQGHNVQAAALMGQVRTAVHAHAHTGISPSDVLARTNRLLTDLNPGLFTSCLYAHIDLDRRQAHLATAGHPPPLIRHPDGRTETLPMTPGLLLGITPDADYPTTTVPLPPGTLLVLYTDGLVENPGTDIDTTTTDLAHRLTRAGHHDVDTLADTLLEHGTRTVPCTDDIALLLIHT
ncbi:SpoIIE family protein phosphatase [Streptomyces sp. NPDC004166]